MKDGSAPAGQVRRRLSAAVSASTQRNVLAYLDAFGDGPAAVEADGATLALASDGDAALIEAQFPGIFTEHAG